MDSRETKRTVPVPSVGADGEQPISQTPTASITEETTENNPPEKNYAELLGQNNVSEQDKQGYLENLQSDETQWKNAKNGDLDRLYDAWSEVLTQIDKGKKARVAAASKVRQILKNCATSPTS